MKLIRKLVLVVASLATLALPARAQDFIAGIPRNQTLIIQGGAAQNADWFNLWAAGGGSATNGLQQLTSDTLWFINPGGRQGRMAERARRGAAGLQRRLRRR